MNIFQNFGVNPILLLAQIVNFLIILYVLKRFMYKPVLNILKSREDEIKKGVEDAQKAEEKLAEAAEKEKQILTHAQERADKILMDAKAEASETKNSAQEKAKAETERMLVQAKEQIMQESSAAEENLTKNIGRIAVALLEKSLTGVFGEKEQKIILKKAETQIGKLRA